MKKLCAVTLMFSLIIFAPFLSAKTEVDQKTMAKIGSLMEKVDKALGKKNDEKAMKLIDEVLQLQADYSPALYQKARMFYGKDQAMAISLLEQAVSSDNSCLPAVKDLAAIHYQNARKVSQGEPATAAAHFEKAAAVSNIETAEKGLYIESLFNAGTLRYQQGNFAAAIPLFEKLTGITETANDMQKNTVRLSYYMLGMAYAQTQKAEPVQKALSRYIELSAALPNDAYLPVARFILAESLMSDLNAMVEKINQDEKEDKIGRIAALAKTKPEIVNLLETAMAQKPEIAESARMYLGNYNFLAGNIDKAIEIYEALTRDFASSEQIGAYQNFLKGIRVEKENRAKAAGKTNKKK